MKKVCILSTVNLKHMTLVSLYTEFMDKEGIEYDIIYIDKYNSNEKVDAKNVYKYNLYIEKEWSFLKKLKEYWGFKKYAIDILLKEKYDFVIVWNSFTAFMFANILKNNFKNKYSVNIRDYGFEKLPPVYFRTGKAIKNSAFTTISSEGFKSFLPKFNYTMVHSLNNKVLSKCQPKEYLVSKENPIRITYIGYMVFYENCFKIMDELGNDDRYILQFFGEGSHIIKEYAKENRYNNVETIGRFEPEETPSLLSQADIIYNLYGVGNTHVDTAISIKLNYAVYMKVPILVFKNTYMAEVSERCGIGYSIQKDDFEGMGNKLFEWYHSQDQKKIIYKCNEYIKKIEEDNLELNMLMEEYLK